MGNWFSSVWDRLFGTQRELKLVIVGLDSAGKSTIIKRMRLDQLAAGDGGASATQSQELLMMDTVPTIGVNTEDITIKNVNIKVFDLAGQEKMRTVWKYYFSSIDGIVFVVDASGGHAKLSDARDELMGVLANEEARHIPVMVFANKQDLPGALKSQEIIEILGISDYVNKKPMSIVRVQECSAKEDQGLLEGFEWLVDKIISLSSAAQS